MQTKVVQVSQVYEFTRWRLQHEAKDKYVLLFLGEGVVENLGASALESNKVYSAR